MLGIQVSNSNMCHIYNKENTEIKQNFLDCACYSILTENGS